MLVTAWHGHSSVQPSCSGHSAALRLYRATSSKQGLYRDLDLGCSPPAEQPASLVNCPLHCNNTTANKSSPTIKAPVCLILQLRPKIGLERRGPPWLVIGFLIVCLAIGSTPCTQICNRSVCGPPKSFQTTDAISGKIRAGAAILYSNGKEMS